MEKILYKKDSKDKTRIWKIYTNGSELIQEAGLLGGKLIRNSKICIGKNIGKSNETSPEEQCLLELESEWKDKKDKGYYDRLEDIGDKIILPMLAKSYKDESKKIDWTKDVYIQPKLDGMRCLAHIRKDGSVDLISRDGKCIPNMNHIINNLSVLKEDLILDGELYAHNYNFQENMRLIKKYRPSETELIKFHVYDSVSDKPYWIRRNNTILVSKKCTEIVLVETHKIIGENDLRIYHSQFIGEGYEGSIIRHGEEGYKTNGRSSNLLKYKDFLDLDIKIKNVEPAEQRPEWGVPVFYWKGAKDDELRAGMKFSHEERKDWLLNKKDYIGKTAIIRFFEYSELGVPRFPVCVGIRLDNEL